LIIGNLDEIDSRHAVTAKKRRDEKERAGTAAAAT